MASHPHPSEDRRVFDAPIHVSQNSDQTITLFLPDGHRLVVSAEAAERTAAMLWRGAIALRRRAGGRLRRRPTDVIPINFSENRSHN